MARRRVFRTRAKCSGITNDLDLTSDRQQMIGRHVIFQKSPDSRSTSCWMALSSANLIPWSRIRWP